MQAEQNLENNVLIALRNEVCTPEELNRFHLAAGAAYGFVAGLSFALLAWGRDAWILAASHTEAPWAKLVFGLPIVLAGCILIGAISGRTKSTLLSILLWSLAGGLIGYLAGRIPYESGNIIVWLSESRIQGEIIFPYGQLGNMMTAISVVVGVLAGAFLGGIESMILDSAWDRSVDGKRLSSRSWATMLVCVPVVLLFSLVIDNYVNRPMREPFQRTHQLIQSGLLEKSLPLEERAYNTIRPFVDRLSESYIIELVNYQSDMTSSYTDVTFDTGLVLRCATARTETTSATKQTVLTCLDFSQTLQEKVDDLIFAGLYGKRRWLTDPRQELVVPDHVMAWLGDHGYQMNEQYRLIKENQKSEWIFMTVEFDNGFAMSCQFRGLVPLVVDDCAAIQESGTVDQAVDQTTIDSGSSLAGIETVPIASLKPEIPWLPPSQSFTQVVSYIGFNTSQPPFDNPTVRQAFAKTVDRPAIALEVLEFADQEAGKRADFQAAQTSRVSSYMTNIFTSQLNYQHPQAATSFVHPDILGRDLYGEIGLAYDPSGARDLLDQAGFADREDFPTVSLTYLDSEIPSAILTSILNTWQRELGVTLTLNPLSAEEFSDILGSGDVDLFFSNWIAEYNDPHGYLALFNQAETAWMSMENDQFTSLVDQAFANSNDPELRQRSYIQAEKILCEDEAIIIPIIHHKINR